VLVIRIGLAVVFATAGVAKLFDLAGSRRAMTAFGVPERAAAITGTVLPVLELAVAVALIPHASARWGGLAALVLMGTFVGGIAWAMARGIEPDCNCFGALHSAPAGPRALIRNLVLAALAIVVTAAGPGRSLGAWIANRSSAEIVAIVIGIVAVALVVAGARMWRELRSLRHRVVHYRQMAAAVPAGLPIGSLAPAFSVRARGGGTTTLSSLLDRGRPVALIFVRPGCGPSEFLIPEFDRWQQALQERLTVAVVGSGSVEVFQQGGITWLEDALVANPVLASDIEHLDGVVSSYRIRATPSVVIVSPDGTIASTTVDGRPAIHALIHQALGRESARPRELVSAA
jgi:uncharacterized membrane protein YphA (DoxX/SURF4 family)/thiol-disulfide isomerase/thioredoxin